jgi:hypothetical protein
LAASENITHRLNEAVKNMDNLKVKVRYTSLALLDVNSRTEQLNTTLHKIFNDGINTAMDNTASITDFLVKF